MIQSLALILVLLFTPTSGAHGQTASIGGQVSVCPAHSIAEPPPPPDALGCRSVPLEKVDLQGRAVWIRGVLDVPRALTDGAIPAGVFVSARAATRAYVNGHLVGGNGTPALDSKDEIAGRLDTVFFVPAQLLKTGSNEVVLLASGHAPAVVASQDLHKIAIGAYGDPRSRTLLDYTPTLLAFGTLMVGAIYFGAMGFLRQENRAALALGTAALLSAGQLLAEVSRGLWNYAYPTHGLRLALIVLLSLGAGLALALHTAERFKVAGKTWFVVGITIAASACALFLPTFDMKTDGITVVTLGGAAGMAILAGRTRQAGAFSYAAAFLALVSLVLVSPTDFHDFWSFLAFGALLLFLFAREASTLLVAERRHEEEAGRRRQLEAALHRLSPTPSATLIVSGAGRRQRISVEEIAALGGAGDYVALQLVDGRELLYTGSLTSLETMLPPNFLRVHRSHIVNLEQIAELCRLSSGVGQLRLHNGKSVPISRRIMPRVRRAMTSTHTQV